MGKYYHGVLTILALSIPLVSLEQEMTRMLSAIGESAYIATQQLFLINWLNFLG